MDPALDLEFTESAELALKGDGAAVAVSAEEAPGPLGHEAAEGVGHGAAAPGRAQAFDLIHLTQLHDVDMVIIENVYSMVVNGCLEVMDGIMEKIGYIRNWQKWCKAE